MTVSSRKSRVHFFDKWSGQLVGHTAARLVYRVAVRLTIWLLILPPVWLSANALAGDTDSGGRLSELLQQRRLLQQSFDRKLAQICQAAESTELTDAWANWRIDGDPSRLYLFPATQLAAKPLRDAEMQRPFRPLRHEHARACYRLAVRALKQEHPALAYQLLNETVAFAPQHKTAAAWLARADLMRATQPSIRPARRRHPLIGWHPDAYYFVTAGNFLITTNDDRRRALQLGNALQQLEACWRQLYFRFWSSTAQLGRSQDGVRAGGQQKRFQVVLFANRDGYLRHISKMEPQAAMTEGYYHAATRTAYFVGGESPNISTWLHEATHQLFQEATTVQPPVDYENNFWLVEGVALHMESLQRCRRWLTLGGLEADRLQFARFRALRAGFFLPLNDLAQLSQQGLQQHPRIGALYSQSAGLVHWMMHGQQGRLRPNFLRFVSDVYGGSADADTREEIFSSSLSNSAQAYHRFLRVDDARLRRLDPDCSIRNLCLGNTAVSDAGMNKLPALDNLVWLDLFGTRVTDRGTKGLDRAKKLKQLSFERTGISDVTVWRLRSTELEQLDLSHTAITDRSMEHVGKMNSLRSLWLTGTGVTDRGLAKLSGLQQLRRLNVQDTSVTDRGRRALQEVLPELQIE